MLELIQEPPEERGSSYSHLSKHLPSITLLILSFSFWPWPLPWVHMEPMVSSFWNSPSDPLSWYSWLGYNKEHLFFLCSWLWEQSFKTLKFLEWLWWEGLYFLFVKWLPAFLSWYWWGGSWMRVAGCQWNQPCDQSTATFNTTTPLRSEQGNAWGLITRD